MHVYHGCNGAIILAQQGLFYPSFIIFLCVSQLSISSKSFLEDKVLLYMLILIEASLFYYLNNGAVWPTFLLFALQLRDQIRWRTGQRVQTFAKIALTKNRPKRAKSLKLSIHSQSTAAIFLVSQQKLQKCFLVQCVFDIFENRVFFRDFGVAVLSSR